MKLLRRLKALLAAPLPYERFVTPLPDGGAIETIVATSQEQADRICAARTNHLVHRDGVTITFEYR